MASRTVVLILVFYQGLIAALATESVPIYSEEGDPRPPFLNRIVRVNRGPTIPTSEEEASLFLKSPVYQLRFRPNRLSQFHGYPTLHGQSPSSNGLNILNIPGIASSSAQSHPHGPSLLSESEELDGSAENQQPTFTPFISARALSNIEKFFEHLRENIEALQSSNSAGGNEAEGRLLHSNPSELDSSSSRNSWEDSSLESDNPLSALRHGPVGFRWLPAASGFLHRDNRVAPHLDSSYFSYSGAEQQQPQQQQAEIGRGRPKFNPSWIKMGLGRRRR